MCIMSGVQWSIAITAKDDGRQRWRAGFFQNAPGGRVSVSGRLGMGMMHGMASDVFGGHRGCRRRLLDAGWAMRL